MILTPTYRTFPNTAYLDYPSTYSLCGTVATSISGVATCLTYQDGCDVNDGATNINARAPTFTYPSHPPLSEGVQSISDLAQDPRGWTYSAIIDLDCDDSLVFEPLFPGLGLWSCQGPTTCVGPAQALQTALLLTATSTSTEAGSPLSTSAKPSIQSSEPVISTPSTILASEGPAAHETAPRLVPSSPTSIENASPATTVAPSATSSPGTQAVVKPPTNNAESRTESQTKVPETMNQTPQPDTLGSLPKVVVPTPVMYTNAQSNSLVSTRLVAATPVPSTASSPSIQLVPVVISSTDTSGSVTLSTSTAAAIAVLSTHTNAQGATFISTSLSTAPLGASIPTVISSINHQGVPVSNTQYVPAVLLSVTNAQGIQITTASPLSPDVAFPSVNAEGSQVVANSPILPVVTAPPALTIGDQMITAESQNQYVIGSQTLSPGGVITASGTPISLALGGTKVVIGTNTQALTPQILTPITSPPILTIGAETITPNAQGQFIVGSQPLTPGGALTISGTSISLAPGGTQAVVGTSTQILAPQVMSAIASSPSLIIGTQTISPNTQGQYVVASQTLSQGNAITVSGTPISLASGGAYAVVGTSTQRLAFTSPPTITVGTQTVTPDTQGRYLIGSQTLTPGGVITVSGTPISLASKGAFAVVGTSTEQMAITSPPPLTIGAQTVTANSLNQYIVGGQTLTPGGVITVSGTRVSLAADETAVVVGSSTEGLGGYIIGGFGGSGGNGSYSGGNGTGTQGFKGGAIKSGQKLPLWTEGTLMGIGIAVVMFL